MRAIIALAVCAILGITVTSAVLGYKAGREIKTVLSDTLTKAMAMPSGASLKTWG